MLLLDVFDAPVLIDRTLVVPLYNLGAVSLIGTIDIKAVSVISDNPVAAD